MAPSLKGETVLLLGPFHHTSDFLATWSKGAGGGLFLPQNWERIQKAPGSPHHISAATLGKRESNACTSHPPTHIRKSRTLTYNCFCPDFPIMLAPLGM